MLVVRRIIAVLLGSVPLVLVGAGIAGVVGEVRPGEPSWYSVRDETALSDALVYAAVGCVGLFGCHRLWRPDAGWKWVLVPIAVLVAAVAIPNFTYWPHGSPLDRASFNMLKRLASFAGSSKQLAQEQGQFACDPSVELFGPSRFMQNGQPLPYVIQCVLNATGPELASPPDRPGTLLFAVSPDRKQAWFAATVLARRTDRHATWLTRQGQPLVIAFTVQEKN
ncbi:MAG: hypothetical protein QM771_10640 [Nitrospira sp.]